MRLSDLSIALDSDSYKYTHFGQFPPDATETTAYLECRGPHSEHDHRIVVLGARQFVEETLLHQWTHAEVDMLAEMMATYGAGQSAHPFPESLFRKFIDENDGYFPVTVQAVMDGTVVYPHVPLLQVTAKAPYAGLITFLETRWTRDLWYPTAVATRSAIVVDAIRKAYDTSVDDANRWTLDYRLHDFGARGCTRPEQAAIGGAAHLLISKGSDTVIAATWARYHLNEGRPVAESIPAMEHATVLSWPTEDAAYRAMMEAFGGGVFAMVLDTYDYVRALTEILPDLAAFKLERGGYLVGRPDSGDPVECVINGLRAMDQMFGHDLNGKGFRVIRGAGIIQGDGIGPDTIDDILRAVLAWGYSAQNVAFGMGGGLLQKVNRDTLKVATKLSSIRGPSGALRRVMKAPATDHGKDSMPGRLRVHRVGPVPMTFPDPCPWDDRCSPVGVDLLQTVYDCGPVAVRWPSFDEMRANIKTQWAELPPKAEVRSPQIIRAMQEVRNGHR
jgi:nicotinamide phosphoribosyltransferase